MKSLGQLDDPHAETAVQWMVDLGSGAVTEGQVRLFEAWLNRDPRNEAAWVKLQVGLMPCGIASSQGISRGALTSRLAKMQSSRRRFLTGLVGFVGAGSIGALSMDRFLPEGALTADHVTLTGQQEQIALTDGSELVLAPRAAVDVRYRPGLRVVRVLDGEVLVKAASHPDPFQVDIDGINLVTNDSVFSIKRRPERISVTSFEGKGVLGAEPSYRIAKGQKIIFANDRFQRETADLEVEMAWADGLLVAKNRTVASIVDDLRPYFIGVIRVSPVIADLRVTAVLRLVDPNGSLEVLADSLGLGIYRVSNYWVSIEPSA